MVSCRPAGPGAGRGEERESGRHKPRWTLLWLASARFTLLPARAPRAPDTRHRLLHGGPQLCFSVRLRVPRASVLKLFRELRTWRALGTRGASTQDCR